MDSPGTWEIRYRPTSKYRGCRGLERDRAHAEISTARERTWRNEVGAGKRINKQPVVGTGSLSALIVLLTSGNAARADPTEGSGAPL
jgi:hypothetical protein